MNVSQENQYCAKPSIIQSPAGAGLFFSYPCPPLAPSQGHYVVFVPQSLDHR
jgi:hypothetical protein